MTALADSVVLAVARQAIADKLKIDTAFAARFYRALATFLSDRMRSTLDRLGDGADQGLMVVVPRSTGRQRGSAEARSRNDRKGRA